MLEIIMPQRWRGLGDKSLASSSMERGDTEELFHGFSGHLGSLALHPININSTPLLDYLRYFSNYSMLAAALKRINRYDIQGMNLGPMTG